MNTNTTSIVQHFHLSCEENVKMFETRKCVRCAAAQAVQAVEMGTFISFITAVHRAANLFFLSVNFPWCCSFSLHVTGRLYRNNEKGSRYQLRNVLQVKCMCVYFPSFAFYFSLFCAGLFFCIFGSLSLTTLILYTTRGIGNMCSYFCECVCE